MSNAPFRLFKNWVHEGGIATPLIVYWPDEVKKSETNLPVRGEHIHLHYHWDRKFLP